MENLVIKGIIENTSNGGNSKFKQDTKTAYITVDETEAEKLENFGLTKYTSQENGNDFFIIKLTKKVVVFNKDFPTGKASSDLSSIDTKNWKTKTVIPMNIIKSKSEEYSNEFFRVQALNVDIENIEFLQPVNPFDVE